MILECPGAKLFKQPEPDQIKCPFCRQEVEIWTDEAKATCLDCGSTVTRKQRQSCLDWCKFAKECVGEDLYRKYLKDKALSRDISKNKA
jgi:transcription initiation factor TFIIIB Brf1 subunit/transcription initiation factor TFIIB